MMSEERSRIASSQSKIVLFRGRRRIEDVHTKMNLQFRGCWRKSGMRVRKQAAMVMPR